VDDALLVGVLNRPADGNEKFEPLPGREPVPIAVIGDAGAANQFHGKVRPAGVSRPGLEYLGDVRMVHQSQGLALGFEAGHDLPGIHAEFDDLHGHLATHRLGLLRPENQTHPTLADFFQQLIARDRTDGMV